METSGQDRINDFAKRIGETLRYVAFGIIATGFAILTMKIDFFNDKLPAVSQLIIWSVALSIIGMMCDYFHSLCGYINSKYKYENKIPETKRGILPIYYLGYSFFYLKQILIIAAAAILIFSVWKIL